MWPSCKVTFLTCMLLGAATLSLYGIAVRSAAQWSIRHISVLRSSDNRSSETFSTVPLTLAAEGECAGLPTNVSIRQLSESGGADWRVYKAFASRKLSSQSVELLSPVAKADIANEVGLNFPVAARVFKLCLSYIKSLNRCHYRLLSDPGPCTPDKATTSVIIVHSLPSSSQRRLDIRERLHRLNFQGYRLIFIIGQSYSIQSEVADVRKEASTYGDVIWADFLEDYDNLTIKTMVMLRWMEENCLTARYLIKADDDVYLKMTNLNAVLTEHLNRSRIVMGTIGYDEEAYRRPDQKWYMPMYMFNGSRYPPFAHGPSYVISTDLIVDLNRAALKVNYIHLEDIFVAVCASTLRDVHHVHRPHFISGSCGVSDAVAMHGLVCAQ